MHLPYVITLGGVAVGLGLVVHSGIRWWYRDKHRIGAAVPFLICFTYGVLAILAAGGGLSLLGFGSWLVLWGGNMAGYLALVYGVGGNSPDVTRAQNVVLTDGGYVVVFLLTVVLFAFWKYAKRWPNDEMGAGVAAGILLGLSGTVAGIAAVPLASVVNALGSPIASM